MKMLSLKAAALALSAALPAGAAPQLALAHNGVAHNGVAHNDKAHHASKAHQDQHVTVNVTSSGYSPSAISVKAGQEVHMTFVSKGSGCANGVRIPSLGKSIDLKQGQKKEIVFTPRKGQTIAFACKMHMFKGKVVAK